MSEALPHPDRVQRRSVLGFTTVFHRIEDDRGRRWKLRDLARASKDSGIRKDLLAPPTHRPDVLRSIGWMGTLGAAAMVPAQTLIAWVQHGDPGFGIQVMFIPIYVIGFGLPMGWMASDRMWRSAAHAREAMLAFDRCPHCVHGLGGIPPESDGCVVCPECGAAWRVPAVIPAEANPRP